MKKGFLRDGLGVLVFLGVAGAAFGLSSCNVVRTITNKSEYYQKGDTAVMIQTKTTESYDATERISGYFR